MNDRWLFIAALVVTGVIVYIVGKIALKQINILLADLKAERESRERFTEKTHASFIDLIARMEKIAQQANDVIENNTQAMKEVANEVSFCRQQKQQNGKRE